VKRPDTGEAGPVARLHAAGKRYRWHSRWVLRDVNLAVDRGCLVEVRGGNGAGKSTLLRMLAGATLPTRGRRLAARGLQVGYGPERLAPAPPFPACAYLAHHVRVRRLPAETGNARAAALADRLGLTAAQLREPLATLSTGSLQKVVIIQALLAEPGLVILDEPFAGLDAAASAALSGLLAESTAAGSTIVFSDHQERADRPRVDLVWQVSDGSVQAAAIEPWTVALPRLPGLVEAEVASRHARLIVSAQVSDQVLAILVTHGWHVTALVTDETPSRIRIEATVPGDPG
jgi:ABC-2 type transport system ATP-binding protein